MNPTKDVGVGNLFMNGEKSKVAQISRSSLFHLLSSDIASSRDEIIFLYGLFTLRAFTRND